MNWLRYTSRSEFLSVLQKWLRWHKSHATSSRMEQWPTPCVCVCVCVCGWVCSGGCSCTYRDVHDNLWTLHVGVEVIKAVSPQATSRLFSTQLGPCRQRRDGIVERSFETGASRLQKYHCLCKFRCTVATRYLSKMNFDDTINLKGLFLRFEDTELKLWQLKESPIRPRTVCACT